MLDVPVKPTSCRLVASFDLRAKIKTTGVMIARRTVRRSTALSECITSAIATHEDRSHSFPRHFGTYAG